MRAGNRNLGALTSILDIKPWPNFFLLHVVKWPLAQGDLRIYKAGLWGVLCWRWLLQEFWVASAAPLICCGLEDVWPTPWGCGEHSWEGILEAAPSPLVAKWKGNLTLSSVSLHTLVLQTPQCVAWLLVKLPAHPHIILHITCFMGIQGQGRELHWQRYGLSACTEARKWLMVSVYHYVCS